jgi:phage terminase large subunit-like protein
VTLLGDRLEYLHRLAHHAHGVDFDVLPHQVAPDGDWFFWLLEAGRGAGKTAAAAHRIRDHMNGPPCISNDLPHRAAIIAPTIGDGIESANLNDQALTRIEPGAALVSTGGGTRVDWPNGSQVRVFGTHTPNDIDRLRAGGNRCIIWAEELASWRYLKDAWEIMMFGLRLGPRPQVIATTTPKARPEYIDVREQADHISHATTLDNPNLNAEQKARLVDLYGDTSIGRQELYGLLIEEAEGAIWSVALIDDGRIVDLLDTEPDLGRGVVAVDPPGGATEAGIVAAAVLPRCPCGGTRLPHFAVLDDRSGKLTPEP